MHRPLKRQRGDRGAGSLATVGVLLWLLGALPVQGELLASFDVPVARGSLAMPADVVVEHPDGSRRAEGTSVASPGDDLVALHVIDEGKAWLCFDTPVMLSGGMTAHPGDVILREGDAWSVARTAASLGIPRGAAIDALSRMPSGQPAFSLDVPVRIGSLAIDPGDLVTIDAGSAASLVFDGSSHGVAPTSNLDAAHLLTPTTLLVSFDAPGRVGSVSYGPADVLEVDLTSGAWQMRYEARTRPEDPPGTDLDALAARGPVPATFAYTSSQGGAITPGATTEFVLLADGSRSVSDLDVLVALSPPFADRVSIYLVHAGLSVPLYQGVGSSEEAGIVARFDDEATSLASGTGSITGVVRPGPGQLAAFDGLSESGTWVLRIVDSGPAGESTHLDSWSIRGLALPVPEPCGGAWVAVATILAAKVRRSLAA